MVMACAENSVRKWETMNWGAIKSTLRNARDKRRDKFWKVSHRNEHWGNLLTSWRKGCSAQPPDNRQSLSLSFLSRTTRRVFTRSSLIRHRSKLIIIFQFPAINKEFPSIAAVGCVVYNNTERIHLTKRTSNPDITFSFHPSRVFIGISIRFMLDPINDALLRNAVANTVK